MADGDFVLNFVVGKPAPVAAPAESKRAKRQQKGTPARTPAAPRNSRPVGSRGPAGYAEELALARAQALKRKHAAVSENGVEAPAVDGDDAADADGSSGGAGKPAWKSQKQPRRDGQASVSSSTADAGSAAIAAEGTAAAAVPAAGGKKGAFVRPTPKPLPRIVRHTPAALDPKELRPVTPQSAANPAVFADADAGDDAPHVSVKRESDEEDSVAKADLPPLPTTGFGSAELGLSERLVRALVFKMEMKYPTRIQKEGIPLLLGRSGAAADSKQPKLIRRRDALIKSETGSGKTLTYLIPIVERLSTMSVRPERSDGTRALVLAPTRELVLQIQGVLQRLLDAGRYYYLIGGILMGGEKRKSEKARMRRGVTILICTPGRLLDHLEHTECFALHKLDCFVLDEADRLMDMGFERDLARIVTLLDDKADGKSTIVAADGSAPPPAIVDPRTGLAIQSSAHKAATLAASQAARRAAANGEPAPEPFRRQNILVSATLNSEIEKMASLTLKDPVMIGFKTDSAAAAIKLEGDEGELINANAAIHETALPEGLVQHYLQVEHRHRLVGLAALLRQKVVEAEMASKHFKCVVFFSTCAAVEFHHSLFSFSFWPYERGQASNWEGVKSALLDTQVLKLHGNLTQQERTRTYQQFCKQAEGILLCTDVAARGLDLPAVDFILQFDPPEDSADYVHRVGRTARMGRKGQAVLFLTAEELDYLGVLKDKSIRPEPLSFAGILQSLHSDAAKNRIYNDARGGTPAGAMLQKQFEALVTAQPALKESAINAYHSYLRAYAAYPRALKAIFHPRKLHIGHVARSFALADAPTLLAKSEVVAKQRANDRRDKEHEQIRAGDRDGDDAATGTAAAKKTATMNARKKLLGSGAAASSGADSAEGEAAISSGVQPAFGQRDRARNVAAQVSDANFQVRVAKRKAQAASQVSTVGWKLGSEGASSGGKQSKLARTGIDRARSNKVAAVFRKKKVDLVSEFAA